MMNLLDELDLNIDLNGEVKFYQEDKTKAF